jgi:hypothetical protein
MAATMFQTACMHDLHAERTKVLGRLNNSMQRPPPLALMPVQCARSIHPAKPFDFHARHSEKRARLRLAPLAAEESCMTSGLDLEDSDFEMRATQQNK